MSRGRGLVWSLALALALCGCKSIGPNTVPRDRFNYSEAIADSWKRQTLLNIIKIRYVEPPVFVDVGQIVAGYSLESSASVGGQVSSAGAAQGDSLLLGSSGKFIDRPTITYTPLTGARFVKGLMMPLPPESVFQMIASGWPADNVLFLACTSINGLKNQEVNLGAAEPAEPEFLRALELMRKIQLSRSVAIRMVTDTNRQESCLLGFRSKDILPESLAEIAELKQLMGLDPSTNEYRMRLGTATVDDQEIVVLTRSLLHIMGIMGAHVALPPSHETAGLALPGFQRGDDDIRGTSLLRIHSSKSRPDRAFVEVQYRDHWFWIDDADLKSKRAFTFVLLLFTLSDTDEREGRPVLTIPAQ